MQSNIRFERLVHEYTYGNVNLAANKIIRLLTENFSAYT